MSPRHPAGTSTTQLIRSLPPTLDEAERLGRGAIISAGYRSLRAFCLGHPECSRESIAAGWKADRISFRQCNAFVAALASDGVKLSQEAITRIFPRVVADAELPAPVVLPADDEAEWGAGAS
jgi:hypothetical protein